MLVQFTFLLHQKSTLALALLFPTCLRIFPHFPPILGMVCHLLLMIVVGRLFVSHVGVHTIGVSGVTHILDGRCE